MRTFVGNQTTAGSTEHGGQVGRLDCLGRNAAELTPPLLSTGEVKARRLAESQTLLTQSAYNSRRGAKEGCACQSAVGPAIVRNDSNNCFASVLLFALMAASSCPTVNLPKSAEVVEHAKPFVQLIETLNEINDPDRCRRVDIRPGELKVCVSSLPRPPTRALTTSTDPRASSR